MADQKVAQMVDQMVVH
jgi:hypothetical protein